MDHGDRAAEKPLIIATVAWISCANFRIESMVRIARLEPCACNWRGMSFRLQLSALLRLHCLVVA
jgi:hypothetical protein